LCRVEESGPHSAFEVIGYDAVATARLVAVHKMKFNLTKAEPVFLRFLLLLAIIPLAELWLLIEITKRTSLGLTIALVLFTGMLGVSLVRWQGMKALREIQQQVASGQSPSLSIIGGVLILLAGAFLLTPGIITDTAGFLLLIPQLRIKKRPVIVANDPLFAGQQKSKLNLRKLCGIGNKTPLLVYSGAVAPQRGLSTVITALSKLPGVHLALIANPENATVKALQIEASAVADRFHVIPYVANSELVSFLSTANIGLIPLHHKLNHEISLITKFGEYMQAKLPIIVSDVKTMAAEVRRLKNGEVFIAENVNSFVAAVNKVLADEKRYKKVYTKTVLKQRSWELQAKVLVDLYNKLVGVKPKIRKGKPFTIKY
jgi:UPF0716 family protein affecting phage T7 exclusion